MESSCRPTRLGACGRVAAAARPKRKALEAAGPGLRGGSNSPEARRSVVAQRLRAAVEDRATALSASSKLSRALMATAAVAPLPVAVGTSARGSEQLPAA